MSITKATNNDDQNANNIVVNFTQLDGIQTTSESKDSFSVYNLTEDAPPQQNISSTFNAGTSFNGVSNDCFLPYLLVPQPSFRVPSTGINYSDLKNTIQAYAWRLSSPRNVDVPDIGQVYATCGGGNICDRVEFAPVLTSYNEVKVPVYDEGGGTYNLLASAESHQDNEYIMQSTSGPVGTPGPSEPVGTPGPSEPVGSSTIISPTPTPVVDVSIPQFTEVDLVDEIIESVYTPAEMLTNIILNSTSYYFYFEQQLNKLKRNLRLGDRILFRNFEDAKNNGVYEIKPRLDRNGNIMRNRGIAVRISPYETNAKIANSSIVISNTDNTSYELNVGINGDSTVGVNNLVFSKITVLSATIPANKTIVVDPNVINVENSIPGFQPYTSYERSYSFEFVIDAPQINNVVNNQTIIQNSSVQLRPILGEEASLAQIPLFVCLVGEKLNSNEKVLLFASTIHYLNGSTARIGIIDNSGEHVETRQLSRIERPIVVLSDKTLISLGSKEAWKTLSLEGLDIKKGVKAGDIIGFLSNNQHLNNIKYILQNSTDLFELDANILKSKVDIEFDTTFYIDLEYQVAELSYSTTLKINIIVDDILDNIEYKDLPSGNNIITNFTDMSITLDHVAWPDSSGAIILKDDTTILSTDHYKFYNISTNAITSGNAVLSFKVPSNINFNNAKVYFSNISGISENITITSGIYAPNINNRTIYGISDKLNQSAISGTIVNSFYVTDIGNTDDDFITNTSTIPILLSPGVNTLQFGVDPFGPLVPPPQWDNPPIIPECSGAQTIAWRLGSQGLGIPLVASDIDSLLTRGPFALFEPECGCWEQPFSIGSVIDKAMLLANLLAQLKLAIAGLNAIRASTPHIVAGIQDAFRKMSALNTAIDALKKARDKAWDDWDLWDDLYRAYINEAMKPPGYKWDGSDSVFERLLEEAKRNGNAAWKKIAILTEYLDEYARQYIGEVFKKLNLEKQLASINASLINQAKIIAGISVAVNTAWASIRNIPINTKKTCPDPNGCITLNEYTCNCECPSGYELIYNPGAFRGFPPPWARLGTDILEDGEIDPVWLAQNLCLPIREITILNYQQPGNTVKFPCLYRQTIWAAARDAGIDLPYSCAAGACSSCSLKMYNQSPFETKDCADQSNQSFLDEDMLSRSWVATCQAYAMTDITLDWANRLDDKLGTYMEEPVNRDPFCWENLSQAPGTKPKKCN